MNGSRATRPAPPGGALPGLVVFVVGVGMLVVCVGGGALVGPAVRVCLRVCLRAVEDAGAVYCVPFLRVEGHGFARIPRGLRAVGWWCLVGVTVVRLIYSLQYVQYSLGIFCRDDLFSIIVN